MLKISFFFHTFFSYFFISIVSKISSILHSAGMPYVLVVYLVIAQTLKIKLFYSTQVWTCGRHFYFFLTDGENWDKAGSCSKPNANHIHIHDYGWELFYQQWMPWQRAYSLKVCGDFSSFPLSYPILPKKKFLSCSVCSSISFLCAFSMVVPLCPICPISPRSMSHFTPGCPKSPQN